MHRLDWFYQNHWGGSIFMIIFWILIIFGIIWLFKNMTNTKEAGERDMRNDNPEEVARRRYAKGEIDKEELEEILKTLKK